jgi:hypothetical protein
MCGNRVSAWFGEAEPADWPEFDWNCPCPCWSKLKIVGFVTRGASQQEARWLSQRPAEPLDAWRPGL